MELLESLFLLCLFLCVYFAPVLIANSREHRNNAAIFVLTLFLGWTILGWVVALIWGFTDNTKEI